MNRQQIACCCTLPARSARPNQAAVRDASFRQKIAQLPAEDSSSPVKRFVILRQRMAALPVEDYFFGAVALV
ncbi:MAG: hypothetical protein RR365_06805 [Bacteroides sp.]